MLLRWFIVINKCLSMHEAYDGHDSDWSVDRGVATWWPGGATATIGQRMATLLAPPTSRHGKKNTKNTPE